MREERIKPVRKILDVTMDIVTAGIIPRRLQEEIDHLRTLKTRQEREVEKRDLAERIIREFASASAEGKRSFIETLLDSSLSEDKDRAQ